MTVRPVLTESAATARATSSATAPLSRSAKERRERISCGKPISHPQYRRTVGIRALRIEGFARRWRHAVYTSIFQPGFALNCPKMEWEKNFRGMGLSRVSTGSGRGICIHVSGQDHHPRNPDSDYGGGLQRRTPLPGCGPVPARPRVDVVDEQVPFGGSDQHTRSPHELHFPVGDYHQ
jgi:hypothetical protein